MDKKNAWSRGFDPGDLYEPVVLIMAILWSSGKNIMILWSWTQNSYDPVILNVEKKWSPYPTIRFPGYRDFQNI